MTRNEILRDIISFAATLSIAAWQGWAARDIIWGLWISSLVIGYSFIVTAVISSHFGGRGPMRRGLRAAGRSGADATPGQGPLGRLLLAPMALFTLCFFTLHFGGFHFIHGLFLNGFFPIVEWNPFGESPGGVSAGFVLIIGKALTEYWPFVLFSAVSRFGDYREASAAEVGQDMFRPYLNVVRMHILIFVFAGLHAADLESYAVYPVLLFYFFPIGSILKAAARLGGNHRPPVASSR